jgi:rhodanese-related sulfurtransferase
MKSKIGKKPVEKGFPGWAVGAMIVVIALVIGFVVYQGMQPQGSRAANTGSLPAEIGITQAAEKRDQGAFILDVRQPEEWQQFHIPGATLIPLGELPNRLNEVPKDRPVVVVCRTGRRSAEGRDILLNAGYPEVTSMAGGVTEWQAQGLPIATGQ